MSRPLKPCLNISASPAAAREPKEGIFVEGAGHEGLALLAADGILAFLARTFPDGA